MAKIQYVIGKNKHIKITAIIGFLSTTVITPVAIIATR